MKALIKIDIPIPINVHEGDYVQFIYDYNKSSLIFPIEDWEMAFETDKKKLKEYNDRMRYYRMNYISDKKLSEKFDGRLINGKLRYFSRIDKIPIFEIDVSLNQLRDDKINEILE